MIAPALMTEGKQLQTSQGVGMGAKGGASAREDHGGGGSSDAGTATPALA
jgi:hypothetical protein